jgi:predicted NBD/HSP70 family sugar kinase
MEDRVVQIDVFSLQERANGIELNDADHRGANVPDERVLLRDLLTASGTQESNRRNLLRVIMAKPGSQAYIAKRAGQVPATVSGAVKELENAGYVSTRRDGASIFVSLRPTAGAAVGIELGFHYTAVVARRVEQGLDDAATRTVDSGAANGANRWLPEVTEAIRDAVADLGDEEIITIGIGIARIVDPRSGKLLPPILPPWSYADDPAHMLAEKLRERGALLTAPAVKIDNDANLAALAESVYSYEEAESLIAIKASTGIGAGIVVAGTIVRGARGAAGEIGHMVMDPNGRFCSCGGRGCLETLIGSDALVDQAKITLAGRPQPSPNNLATLITMAREGNATCQRVLREAAATLGMAIGSLCNVLNPEVVVLGGAFGRTDAAEFTLEPCREAIGRSGLAAAVRGVRMSAAQRQAEGADKKGLRVEASAIEHAAAHGALIMALQGTDYGTETAGTSQ